jgi:hypothetical protein
MVDCTWESCNWKWKPLSPGSEKPPVFNTEYQYAGGESTYAEYCVELDRVSFEESLSPTARVFTINKCGGTTYSDAKARERNRRVCKSSESTHLLVDVKADGRNTKEWIAGLQNYQQYLTALRGTKEENETYKIYIHFQPNAK